MGCGGRVQRGEGTGPTSRACFELASEEEMTGGEDGHPAGVVVAEMGRLGRRRGPQRALGRGF